MTGLGQTSLRTCGPGTRTWIVSLIPIFRLISYSPFTGGPVPMLPSSGHTHTDLSHHGNDRSGLFCQSRLGLILRPTHGALKSIYHGIFLFLSLHPPFLHPY